MRRHPSRDSPNCTREFGPIDAMRRERLLAPARTGTQSRDIELTQRVVGRRADDATFAVGLVVAVTGGFVAMTRAASTFVGGVTTGATSGAAATRAASVGPTARGTLSRAVLSRAALSVVATAVVAMGACEVAVSAIATFVASAVSSESGAGAFTPAAVFAR